MFNVSKLAGTAAVLFLGAIIPLYGQKEEEKKEPPQQHAQQPQQAKPQAPQAQPHAQQPRQEPQQAKAPVQQTKPSPVQQPQQHTQAAPQQQNHAAQAPARPQPQAHVQQPQPVRSQKEAQSWQQQRGWTKQGGGWQPHTTFQQGRDQNWASDHRSWAQRGGYGGFYIPQATFGLSFGSAHFFRIGVMPVMYMGYPRFGYGGFSFMLLDPWPGSWQQNWYASDDVYIDYTDGYYLHDRRYPGVSLAVSVAL